MDRNTINITDKNIREFTENDTIYIKKNENGHSIMYLCNFVKFEKGNVTGKVISAEPNWALHQSEVGILKSARLANCFLWGKKDGENNNVCHWFGKDGFV